MRICGVPENLITGQETADFDKFMAWAKCFPDTIGSPLFHWSSMELKQLFGFDEMLTTKNAEGLWELSNHQLKQEEFRAKNIVKRFGVELMCTSDDLLDSLEHHIAMSDVEFRGSEHSEISNPKSQISCLPSLRSDSILALNQHSFLRWMHKLEILTESSIENLDEYLIAITKRLDFFNQCGCLLADHSLDSGFQYISTSAIEASKIFDSVLKEEELSTTNLVRVQSYLLHFLGIEYANRQWKMQLHIGAYRYTNSTLRKKVGPAGGFACIGNTADVSSLSRFLDELDSKNSLPQTIIYTLNPADNAVFASLTGSFAQDNIRGKVQFGPAWWYNDHYEGIVQHLLDLSSYSLLAINIGFTTDSRSILSFTRHEYFRRILCNLIGSWVKEGKLPNDDTYLVDLIKKISYLNIKNWLKKQ
jgi:glucuronate isomerase